MERKELPRKTGSVVFFLLCCTSGVLLASASGPVLATTGDFGEGNCMGCYGDFSPNASGGSIEIQGVLPTHAAGFIFQYPAASRQGSVVLIGEGGKRFAVVW